MQRVNERFVARSAQPRLIDRGRKRILHL